MCEQYHFFQTNVHYFHQQWISCAVILLTHLS